MNDIETGTIPQVLATHGFIIHKIKGTSMLPFLNEDTDLVRLVVPKERLRRFDIALYPSQNKGFILHRVLEVKKNYYLIAGDNNAYYEKVPFDKVLAVAEGYYTDGTYIPCDDPAYLGKVEEYCKTPVRKREKLKKPLRLTAEHRYLAHLFRHAVCALPMSEPYDFAGSWESLYRLAVHQKVAAMLYPLVKDTDCPEGIKKHWKQHADMTLRKEILFDAERCALMKLLEEHGIATIPLKGILIKELYPRKGMREFTDNDLLYDTAKRSELLTIMQERGYEMESGATHDIFQKKPVYHFEFHKVLFVKKNPLHRYFSDMWKRATPVAEGKYEHRLSVEDFYLYTLAHAHKHYASAGIGIRFLADIHLMRRAWIDTGDADIAYIERMLNKMYLREFHTLCVTCADSLFSGDLDGADPNQLGQFFSGGAFGSLEQKITSKIASVGRLTYLRERIFIPYDQMVSIYPFLKKCPLLLPFCWMHKVWLVLFTKQKRDHFKAELRLLFRRKNDDD
ncbi:MAG: nucleotidyltransferase family protein [Clostridia bacterium]|nr:nucleotidyltransferase family protein [Clostridia bacterium]